MLNPCRNELCYSSRRLLTNHSFRMCARVHVKGSADHSGLSTVFVKYQKKNKKKHGTTLGWLGWWFWLKGPERETSHTTSQDALLQQITKKTPGRLERRQPAATRVAASGRLVWWNAFAMHLIWLQTRLPPATVASDVDILPLGVKLHEAPVSQVYLSYLLQVDAINLRHWAEFTRTTRPKKNKVDINVNAKGKVTALYFSSLKSCYL